MLKTLLGGHKIWGIPIFAGFCHDPPIKVLKKKISNQPLTAADSTGTRNVPYIHLSECGESHKLPSIVEVGHVGCIHTPLLCYTGMLTFDFSSS